MNRVFDLNGRLHQTHRNILISNDQSVGDPDGLHEVLEEGTTVIAGSACSYDLMFYEKLLPTFQDLAKRYPHFYANKIGRAHV